MAHQCKICFNDFSWDPSSKDKSRLPVQSRVCSHMLCHGCVVSIFEAAPSQFNYDDEDVADTVPCPECRLPNAHNPFAPIISLALCDLLAERHALVKMLPHDCVHSPFYDMHPLTRASALAQQSLMGLWHCILLELQKERPSWRIYVTKQAAQAIYWSSFVLFGRIQVGESQLPKECKTKHKRPQSPRKMPSILDPQSPQSSAHVLDPHVLSGFFES